MNKATEAREWETDAYSNNRQVTEMRVCERQGQRYDRWNWKGRSGLESKFREGDNVNWIFTGS